MTFHGGLNHLLKYELPVLFLITLGAMALQSLLIVATMLIVFWGIVRFLTKKEVRQIFVSPVDLPVIGLCLLLPLTWWITIDRETTGWQILRIFNGIGIFYAIIHWLLNEVSITKSHKLIFVCEVIGVFVVAMGLISTKWPVGKSDTFNYVYYYLLKFSSESTHPNVLAGTIVLFLPIPLVFLLLWLLDSLYKRPETFSPYPTGWLVWHGAVALILLLVLLLTQSRGGILGMGAATFVLVFILTRNSFRVFLFSLIVFIGIIGLLFPQNFSSLVASLISDSAISTGALRLEVWSRAYYMIQDFPFTGIGMGNFRTLLDLMYPLFLTTEIIPHAHNLYLQIGADLGIIGLICWLAIIIIVIFSLCVIIRRNMGRLEQPKFLLIYLLATGLLSSQTALLAHGFVDAVTWGGVRTAPFVWISWGIAIALYLSDRTSSTT